MLFFFFFFLKKMYLIFFNTFSVHRQKKPFKHTPLQSIPIHSYIPFSKFQYNACSCSTFMLLHIQLQKNYKKKIFQGVSYSKHFCKNRLQEVKYIHLHENIWKTCQIQTIALIFLFSVLYCINIDFFDGTFKYSKK